MPGRARRAIVWAAAAALVALAVPAAAWTLVVRSGWIAGAVREALVVRLAGEIHRPVALGAVSGDPLRGIDLRDFVIGERGGLSHGVAFSADRIRLTFDLRHLLLHPGEVVQSIARVEVQAPRLEVARDARGMWNLGDLLAAPAGPLGPQFHGRIVVRDGIVAYADAYEVAAPFRTRFGGIAGAIDFTQAQRPSAELSGRSTDGEDLTLRGRYFPAEGTADLDLAVARGAVQHWGGYLVRLSDLRWLGGRFGGRVHLLLARSPRGLLVDYAGTVRIEDAAAEYLPTHIALRHVRGTLALDTGHASTAGLALTADGSPLRIRGDVAYPGGTWLDLVVTSPGLDLGTVRALLFPDARIGLSGRAAGDVWITGPAASPYLDGDITSARGRLNRRAFEGLSTRFQYAAGTLAFRDLRARLGGGQVAGDAVVAVSGEAPSFQFAATAENVDAGSLPAAGLAVTDGLAGRFSGHLAGVGAPGGVRLIGGVTMPDGEVRGLAFRDLGVLFWDDGGSVDLDFLHGNVGQATLHASGRISPAGALDLALDARNVPLSEVGVRAGLGPTALRGQADLSGHLGGTEAAPVVSGTATAWDGSVGPVPFAFARGDLVVSPAAVASRGLDLLDGATSYHLSGGLRLHPLAAENLHVDVEEASASRLARNVPHAPEITGTLSAHVTLSGPLAGPAGAGVITLRQGSIAGQPLDRAEVRFAAGGRQQVQILSADAERSGARVHAEGTVDLRGPLDLRLSATGIRIEDAGRTLGSALSPQGTLALSGVVAGTLGDPELRTLVHSPDFMIGGEAFSASGLIDYRAGLLRAEPLVLARDASRYTLTGRLRVGPHPWADLALDVANGQIAEIASAAGLRLPTPVGGTVDGRITFTGPLADPSARLALTMRDGELGGIPLGTGAADLTLSHGSVDIRRLELTPDHGQILAQGRVVLAGASNVEVSARDLDPNVLRPLLHLDRPLVGRLDFTMQWSGPTRNPTAGLSLEARNAGVPGAVADRIVALAYYKEGTVHVEDATIEKGPHKVVVQGSLPVVPGSLALDPQGPLDLQLHLRDADLSFLSLLTRQVQDASGTVQGEVSIGGTVSSPRMHGSVRAQGGHLRIDPMRTPLEDVGVDIVFSQDQVLVRDLSAVIGGGRAAVHGTVAISNLRPEALALDLTAQQVTADVPGLYAGQVDAALTLAGPAAHPVLAGTATLSNGRVEVDGGFAPAAPRHAAVGLAVNVAAGDNVAFDAGVVRAHLAGEVRVGGTLGAPRLSGTVRSLDGTVAILGTPFTIVEGEAAFSEALGFEPQIRARAQAMYGDTQVFLDVQGVLPNATLVWSSEPPMSQQDILALVAGSSGYSGSAAGLAGQELGRMFLGSVGQAIQRALHLDEFTVSYSTQNPVTLRIGKFIVRSLYLSLTEVFGRPTSPDTPVPPVPGPGLLTRLSYTGQPYTVLGLEYFLSPSVFLSYNVDTLGDNAIFLLTRYPF